MTSASNFSATPTPDLLSSLRLSNPWKRLAAVLFVIALLAVYVYGAMMQDKYVNDGSSDQEAYTEYALRLVDDPGYIDGSRMPLVPFMARIFYQPGMDEDAMYRVGVNVGLVTSIVCLAIISAILFVWFPALLAATIALITAFTLYIFKAAYFQPELLFATLFFVGFVLSYRAFRHLTPLLSLAIGAIFGLAMLAKGSAVLGLAAFVAVMGLKILIDTARSHEPGRIMTLVKQLAVLALSLVAFGVVMSGYITSSHRIFGTYYYNVNTTFYLWYDSWDDVKDGTRDYSDRVGWPTMPADQLPTMSKYLSEHTPDQIVQRMTYGIRRIYTAHCSKDDQTTSVHCDYMELFGIAAIVAILVAPLAFWRRLRRNGYRLLFAALVFLAYLASAAWWAYINPGQRFTLMLVLPLFFLLALVLSQPEVRQRALTVAHRRVTALNLLLAFTLIALAVDTVITVTSRVYWMYGGH